MTLFEHKASATYFLIPPAMEINPLRDTPQHLVLFLKDVSHLPLTLFPVKEKSLPK